MKNLFLFTGEEAYLLQEQIQLWKKAFVEKHGEFNLEELDGTQLPINEIMAALQAIPFLGEKRLVFVHGLPEPPKTKNPDKVSKKEEEKNDQLQKMAERLEQIPASTVVVFVQSNPDKRRFFYKHLVKTAEVKEFNALVGSSLTRWIQERVQRAGGKMSPAAADYLFQTAGSDLWRLSKEIEKLTTCSPGGTLSNILIDQLVMPTVEANVFQLTDALALKDSKKGIYQLHRLMAAGENLQPVLYMIIRQFRLLLLARAFMDQDPQASPTAFGARLKLHPFVAKNTVAQVKNFKMNQLKRAYQHLLQIDIGLKTSQIRVLADDQDELALALECFILEFAGA